MISRFLVIVHVFWPFWETIHPITPYYVTTPSYVHLKFCIFILSPTPQNTVLFDSPGHLEPLWDVINIFSQQSSTWKIIVKYMGWTNLEVIADLSCLLANKTTTSIYIRLMHTSEASGMTPVPIYKTSFLCLLNLTLEIHPTYCTLDMTDSAHILPSLFTPVPKNPVLVKSIILIQQHFTHWAFIKYTGLTNCVGRAKLKVIQTYIT